jgi:hypothetical protein
MRYVLLLLLFTLPLAATDWEGFGSWSSSGGIGGNYSSSVLIKNHTILNLYHDHHGKHARKIDCDIETQELTVNDRFIATVYCKNASCYITWSEGDDILTESWKIIDKKLFRTGSRKTKKNIAKWEDTSFGNKTKNPIISCLQTF